MLSSTEERGARQSVQIGKSSWHTKVLGFSGHWRELLSSPALAMSSST
jgi:hypothetical protein